MLPTTSPLMTSWSRYWNVTVPPSQFLHGKRRLDVRGLSVLVLDDRVHRDRRQPPVHPLDHVPVSGLNEGPPHLPRPGQLVVVGVELLVQEHELADPRRRRKRFVHLG